MPSADFERRTEQVLRVVEAIPPGRCRSYKDVGDVVGIVPRYVALIMASAPEVSTVPWHRVVGHDGRIKPGPQSAEQKRRLEDEGLVISADGRIEDFNSRRLHNSE